MPETATLSFKEMCEKFDVTPRTLRYYEYIELLRPQKMGRSRSYGPREVARMTLILRARRFGFPLEDIRQWLDLYSKEGSRAQFQEFITRADHQLTELDRQIAELTTARNDLDTLRRQAIDVIAQSESAPAANRTLRREG